MHVYLPIWSAIANTESRKLNASSHRTKTHHFPVRQADSLRRPASQPSHCSLYSKRLLGLYLYSIYLLAQLRCSIFVGLSNTQHRSREFVTTATFWILLAHNWIQLVGGTRLTNSNTAPKGKVAPVQVLVLGGLSRIFFLFLMGIWLFAEAIPARGPTDCREQEA